MFIKFVQKVVGWQTTGWKKTPRIFVHLHIPRTGGSFFQGMLSANFDKRNVLSAGGLEIAAPSNCDPNRPILYTGHIPFDARGLNWRKANYLILLRHPVERLKSLYKYTKSRPTHQFYELFNRPYLNWEEFLSGGLARQFCNGQVRQICGNARWSKVSLDRRDLRLAVRRLQQRNVLVGVTENLPEFLEECSDRFGFVFPCDAPRNISLAMDFAKDPFWQHAEVALTKRNQLDFTLYDIAVELVRRRCQTARLSLAKDAARDDWREQ